MHVSGRLCILGVTNGKFYKVMIVIIARMVVGKDLLR